MQTFHLIVILFLRLFILPIFLKKILCLLMKSVDFIGIFLATFYVILCKLHSVYFDQVIYRSCYIFLKKTLDIRGVTSNVTVDFSHC